jgi:putative nucleotidyltransferase with HDIG domain
MRQQHQSAFIHEALQAVSLPPRAVRELLRISQAPDVDTKRIVDTITSDEALTARVIRVVNSALFSVKREITSVQQAIVLLGREAIVQIAVGVAALHIDTSTSGSLPLSRRSFWRHSMSTAFLARQMSATEGEVNAEQAFTAGLLHDIGKLILMGYLGPEYAHVLNQAKQDDRPLEAVELEMLGVDHDTIGRELCDRWKLSASLRDGASIHGVDGDASPLTQVVRAANAAAKALGVGGSGNLHVNLQYVGREGLREATRDLAYLRSLPEEVARIEQAFRFSGDPEVEEAGSSVMTSEKGTILIQVQNQVLAALLAIVLCGLGYTPRFGRLEGMKGSGTARSTPADGDLVAGIADESSTPQTAEMPWLDVASWRRAHPNGEGEIINLAALRDWLDHTLQARRPEEA